MQPHRGVVLLVALAGCASTTGAEDPPPVETVPALVPLTDTNPDPRIVEVQLVAAPARHAFDDRGASDVWAFRDGAVDGRVGVVPGPLLEANVGDLVIVHFRNELPDPTTVHWHGLRLPSAMDGSTSTQRAVQPGEEFEYRFTVSDAGTFWYHPHVASDVQVERGLQGPIVVHEAIPLPVDRERVLVIDDVKLDVDGHFDERADDFDIMYGREGNAWLVNGVRGGSIVAQHGARELWRIINTANARYFRLALDGVEFTVVGSDGGLLHAPYTSSSLLIAPGERFEVIVELPRNVATTTLNDLGHQRAPVLPPPRARTLMTVKLDGTAQAHEPLSYPWPAFERLQVGSNSPRQPMVLREQMSETLPPRFFINDEAWPFNRAIEVVQGALEVWELRNTSEMNHPFHLHGLFFQVLDDAFGAREELGWKDTVDVGPMETVRLAVRYDAEGMWMFHCQILEHAERGMMGDLMVHPAH